ncbi:MAG: amino acid adenylation domain-containing protein [Candidatus Omnitrophota bacterium]
MHRSGLSDFDRLWIAAGKKAKEKEYWLEKLSGELSVSRFPYSHVNKNITTENLDSDSVCIEFDKDISSSLVKWSADSDIRLYIILNAVLALLLSKYTGNEDIIIGTPVSHGAHGEHGEKSNEGAGFINTVLALRHQLNGEISFKELLFQVRQTIIEANENQNYPFEVLVRQLEIPFSEEERPLFDVALVLENIQDKEHLSVINPKVIFSFLRVEEIIEGKIEYNPRFYHRQMIERISLHFGHMIEIILSDPDKKISEIEIITEEEKRQLLNDFNNTAAEYPRDKTIHELFEEQVIKAPDCIALLGPTSVGALREAPPSQNSNWAIRESPLQISYGELNERSQKLADELIQKGVGTDTIVGIKIGRSIEMIIGLLGILKAGGAYLPIDPDYPQERIEYMLKDSQARFLVTHSVGADPRICPNTFKILGAYIDAPLQRDIHVGADPCVCPSAFFLPASDNRQLANLLAYVIYTSGTTGKPKGTLIEHRNVVRLMVNDLFQFEFNDRDIWTMFHSYCFDFSVWEMFGALLYGGKLIIISKALARDTEKYLELLKKEKVTVLNQTPSAFYNLMSVALSASQKKESELSLRYIIFGGEALQPSRLKEWKDKYPHTRLINMYGITETTVHVTFKEIGEIELESGISNIGRPIPTLTVYVLDKYMNFLPVGVSGEMHVGGDGVGRGYLNRSELTWEKFFNLSNLSITKSFGGAFFKKRPAGGIFYRTGDLGRWLENGNLEYLGRIDNQVKIRGFRIELGEIETQLLRHRDIKDAVVIARENNAGDKSLCAYIVSDEILDVEELRNYLSHELPEYMVPSCFLFPDRIPLTSNGKVDRKALPEPGIKEEKGYVAPENEIEKQLVDIWSDILGIDENKISIDSDFFELGGHSLKAALLVSHVHKIFDVNMSLTDVFTHPTIRDLSGFINEAAKETYLSIDPVEKKEYYLLSSAQRRLYVLHQMDEKGVNYNIPSFFVLEGEIDKEKLEKTFKLLIDRHESLRTSFHMIDDEPVQRIHRQVEFRINHIAVPQPKVFAELFSKSDPFDLSKAPLIRVGLIEIEDKMSLLAVDMHHIISDGTSMNIVVQDFMALYRGEDLPEFQIQYKDFSEWQKRENQCELLKQQEAFWLNEFEGEIPVLDLPLDFSRPSVQSFEGRNIHFELDKGTTVVLKTLALETGTTLYMVLLALYNIFLSKVSNQEDIVIGSPIAGRRHSDLEKVVGMFVNTLALRNSLLGEKPFIGFLEEVKGNTLRAFENQEYPYEELVERVVINRDTGRNPLFDTMFILQNTDMQELEIPGLKLTTYEYENKISKFDLTLSGIEVRDKILFTFEYCNRLFKSETIEQFIVYFKNIINGVITDKDRRISDFEIITKEEKNRILYDFNDTETEYPKEKTIYQLFEEQAARTPDYLALIGSSFVGADPCVCPQFSYKELNDRSDQFAQYLIQKGVGPDTIVGIKIKRSVEMIIGILGILKAGGAYLPIDPDYPQERVDYILKDSQALFLVTHSVGADLCACPCVRDEKEFGEKLGAHVGAPLHLNKNKNLAYIIYTSGSTGRPKGVLVEHASVVNLLYAIQQRYPFGLSDIYLLKTSYVFDVSVTELFGWFMGGGKLVLLENGGEKDPRVILGMIERNGVSHINFVPSMFNTFIGYLGMENKLHIASLKCIFLAGEALLPELVKKFNDLNTSIKLENIYGPTESTVYASWYSLAPGIESASIPIGKPLPNIRLYILDNYHRLQPTGITGELYISGKGLARGYLNRPELTFEKFTGCRLYSTGDLCRWRDDGTIEFLGRMDQQVKIRGFRIELGEIENRLLTHEKVKEAVVVEKEDRGDKYLAAYFISDADLSESELRQYLSKNLPEYMIPSYFMRLNVLPLTATGKLDRKSLPFFEMKVSRGYIAPGNAIEEKLAELWSDILGRRKELIGVTDNFFELGGHSLKATILISKIQKLFHVNIPLGEIFKTSTIRGLSDYIKESVKETYISIESVEKKEYYPLSSAQKRLYVLHQMDEKGISYNIPSFFILEGELDKNRFEQTFKRLIDRHESLRTSFHLIDEEPVQRIHDDVEFEISYLATEDTEVTAGGRKTVRGIENVVKSFDLTKAPLMRVGLIEIEKKTLLLAVDMHHIISDGASIEIMIKDFMAFYQGNALPRLRVQYKDFSDWQKTEKQRELIKRQAEFWLKAFEEEIPVLDLPIDFPRPVVQSFEGKAIPFEIDQTTTDLLKKLALATHTTLYMVLVTIYNIFLSKLSNQEDIVIGSPVAGRRHADWEPIIGMFVNTLALRNSPIGEKEFTAFLKEVKGNTLSAFENQDYPYEELVERVVITRDVTRNPLFDTMFVLQNTERQALEIPGLKLTPYEYESSVSKFDLTLSGIEVEGKLVLTLEYCTKLFKPETVERFIVYFKNIVNSLVENRYKKLSDFEIISEEEKNRILNEFNNTNAKYPKDKTIHQLFEEQAARTPNQIALIGPTLVKAAPCVCPQVSYKELNERSEQFAQYLIQKGVQSDTIVGIKIERSTEMVIGILGILKAGGAYLPVDADYHQERINYMLADSCARLLLTQNEITKSFCGASFKKRPAGGVQNLAYIIYTSGSTGNPKGVMVEHQNVIRLVKNTNFIDFQPEDRILQTGALAFDASTFEIWGSLLNGLGLDLMVKEDILNPEKLKMCINENKITVMWMTSPLFNQMVQSDEEIFGPLRCLLVGGDVLSPSHINRVRKRFPGLKIINGYGPTENTTFSTTFLIDKEYKEKIPIGKSIANSTAYIVDKSGKLQPLGIAGELWVGGDGVSRGYLNNPELTAERFFSVTSAAKILYKTGDLCRWLNDGNIQFLSRMDQQVKIRGFRIELEEIENRLLSYKKIKEAVVVLNENSGDKYLAAYFVSDADLSKSELRQYLSKHLPGYMVPSYLMHLNALPLTATGKIDRKSLPSLEMRMDQGHIAPGSAIEEKLADLWSEILGRRKELIGVTDNFFEFGGHSLKAAVLISKIHKIFHVNMPLGQIFKNSTIRGLSNYIKESVKERYISIEPVEKKEYYPLSSAQKRLYVLNQMDEKGINYNIPAFFVLEGRINKNRIEQTFKRLTDRHESLRTSFHIIEGEPVQRVHDEIAFKIEFLTGRTESTEEGERLSRIGNFVKQFNLSKAPLIRVELIEIEESRHLLAVDMHHIISDGTSMNIVVNDFMAFYRGEDSPALRVQYKDYSEWQKKSNQKELKQQEEFWLNEFEGEIPVLDLPLDFSRPSTQSFEGRSIWSELDKLTDMTNEEKISLELEKEIYEDHLINNLECIEKLNKGRNEKNIFLIHALHGMVNQYNEFALLLEKKYNVYGIQSRGVKTGSRVSRTPNQMINDYLDQILSVQKGGSYIIGGYCNGIKIGYEIVRRLEKLNFPVERLIVFDPHHFPRTIKILRKIEYFPDVFKKVFFSIIDKKFEKALKLQNLNIEGGNLNKEEFETYMIVLSKHILPFNIIKSPLLAIIADTSNRDGVPVNEEDLIKMTKGKATIVRTPGDHNSIWEKPYVEKLAEAVINNL